MSIKSKFSKEVAKIVRTGLKLTKRKGTSLPGYVGYKLDKDILNELSENTKFIFITGTNGKTMTTHFLVNILKQKYDKVYTNDSGSNMVQGIITTLLDNPKNEETIAVLEVDEANLVRIGKNIKADYVVFTNIFKDQLDRFGNINNVYEKLMDGMATMPDAKIIANGDLPIFNYPEMSNYDTRYFAIRDYDKNGSEAYNLDPDLKEDGIYCPNCNHQLKYKLNNYASLGDYSCPNCDFKTPVISYQINKLTDLSAKYSSFEIGNEHYEINVGGIYNVYNALAALSVAKELGLSYEEIYNGLITQKNISGRQEKVEILGKNIIINLVKNPTGLNQIIDLMMLEDKDITLICLLNDNYADGKDINWINDASYEKLKDLDIIDVYVSGIRKVDMKERLETADMFDGPIVEFDYETEIDDIIKNSKSKNIYVLSTYTAMNRLREVLGL